MQANALENCKLASLSLDQLSVRWWADACPVLCLAIVVLDRDWSKAQDGLDRASDADRLSGESDSSNQADSVLVVDDSSFRQFNVLEYVIDFYSPELRNLRMGKQKFSSERPGKGIFDEEKGPRGIGGDIFLEVVAAGDVVDVEVVSCQDSRWSEAMDLDGPVGTGFPELRNAPDVLDMIPADQVTI
jgi:hypothetical protein